MPDEDKTFSGSLVLDLRIWWRHVHTPYTDTLKLFRLETIRTNSTYHIHGNDKGSDYKANLRETDRQNQIDMKTVCLSPSFLFAWFSPKE